MLPTKQKPSLSCASQTETPLGSRSYWGRWILASKNNSCTDISYGEKRTHCSLWALMYGKQDLMTGWVHGAVLLLIRAYSVSQDCRISLGGVWWCTDNTLSSQVTWGPWCLWINPAHPAPSEGGIIISISTQEGSTAGLVLAHPGSRCRLY